MLKTIVGAIAGAAFFGVFVSWLIMTINMIRVTGHIKEGVTIYGRKTNVLFRPHELTDRGLAVRRWFFYGLIGFFACLLIGFALGALAGLMQPPDANS